MKIYLIQFQNENGYNQGSPLLTASETVAKATLKACKNSGKKAYINKYEVKTQGKNFENFAVAQYYDETEEPF